MRATSGLAASDSWNLTAIPISREHASGGDPGGTGRAKGSQPPANIEHGTFEVGTTTCATSRADAAP